MELEWPNVRVRYSDGRIKTHYMGDDADVWAVLARIEKNFMGITDEIRAERAAAELARVDGVEREMKRRKKAKRK